MIKGTCPWCDTPVRDDGIGGMEPFATDGKFWHWGCLADWARYELEAEVVE